MDPPPSIILILSLLFWSWSGALIVISSSPINSDTLNDTTITTTTTELTLVVQNHYESNENLTANVTTTRSRRHFLRLFSAPRRMIVIGAAIPKDGRPLSWNHLKEAMDHGVDHPRNHGHSPFSTLLSMMTNSAGGQHGGFLTESQRAFAAINDNYPEALRLRLSRAVRRDRGLRGLVKVDPRGVSCRDVCTPNSIGFGLIGFCTNVYCQCGPLPFPARTTKTRANIPGYHDETEDDQDWFESVTMDMRENRMLSCPARHVFDPDRLVCDLPGRTSLCSDVHHHQVNHHQYSASHEAKDEDQSEEGDDARPFWREVPRQRRMPWMSALSWFRSKSNSNSKPERPRPPPPRPTGHRFRASGEKPSAYDVPVQSPPWNALIPYAVTPFRPPMHLDYPATHYSPMQGFSSVEPTLPPTLLNPLPQSETSLRVNSLPDASSQVIYGVPLTTTAANTSTTTESSGVSSSVSTTSTSTSTPSVPPPTLPPPTIPTNAPPTYLPPRPPTYLPPPTTTTTTTTTAKTTPTTTTDKWPAPISISYSTSPKPASVSTPSSQSLKPNTKQANKSPVYSSTSSSSSKQPAPVYFYTLKTAALKDQPPRSRKRPTFKQSIRNQALQEEELDDDEEEFEDDEDYGDFVQAKPGAIPSQFGYGNL